MLSGTFIPADSAILDALFPATAPFNVPFSGFIMYAVSFSVSSSLKNAQPFLIIMFSNSEDISSSTTTDCSEAQIIPLSKVLERIKSLQALSKFALFSI